MTSYQNQCHSNYECTLSQFSHIQLFAALWTVALQAPLFMGYSRQEDWSGQPIPSLGDLSDPGIELGPPALQADSLPVLPPGKPQLSMVTMIFLVQIFYLYAVYIKMQFSSFFVCLFFFFYKSTFIINSLKSKLIVLAGKVD